MIGVGRIGLVSSGMDMVSAWRRAEFVGKGAIGFGVLAWATTGALGPAVGLVPSQGAMALAAAMGACLGAALGARAKVSHP